MSDRREVRDSQDGWRVQPSSPVSQEVARLLAEIEKIDAALARPCPLDRAA
jgi:hypothetical protein